MKAMEMIQVSNYGYYYMASYSGLHAQLLGYLETVMAKYNINSSDGNKILQVHSLMYIR